MVTQFECVRCHKIQPIGDGTWLGNGGYGMVLHCKKCIEETKGSSGFIKRLLRNK